MNHSLPVTYAGEPWCCDAMGKVQLCCYGWDFQWNTLSPVIADCIKPSPASPDPPEPYAVWKCEECDWIACQACCDAGARAPCRHELTLYLQRGEGWEPLLTRRAVRRCSHNKTKCYPNCSGGRDWNGDGRTDCSGKAWDGSAWVPYDD